MAGAPRGGAENFFQRLLPSLAEAGVEQMAVIRRHAERHAALTNAGIPVKELAFANKFDVVSQWRLRRVIKTWQPAVIMSWMSRAAAATGMARIGLRGVHAARLGGYYRLKYYRGADHLVGNTHDIVRYLKDSGWDPRRIHYLPNFVDEQPMPALPRSQLNTPADAKLILAMGRLHTNKAFDTLLHALAGLPDHWLWLAGTGPEAAQLNRLAESLGVIDRVRFLGWREDIPALLAAADLFVCSSRREPLGNVVLEAWAQGVPVIATAAEGPRELIRHGETGILVPIDQSDSLARAVADLTDDTGKALVDAGLKYYRDNFSESAVVSKYAQFFEEIAG